jgi:hypothetical protein
MIHRRKLPRAQWVRANKDPYTRHIVATERLIGFCGHTVDRHTLECGHVHYRSVWAADRVVTWLRCTGCIDADLAKKPARRGRRMSDAEALIGWYTHGGTGRASAMETARRVLEAAA